MSLPKTPTPSQPGKPSVASEAAPTAPNFTRSGVTLLRGFPKSCATGKFQLTWNNNDPVVPDGFTYDRYHGIDEDADIRHQRIEDGPNSTVYTLGGDPIMYARNLVAETKLLEQWNFDKSQFERQERDKAWASSLQSKQGEQKEDDNQRSSDRDNGMEIGDETIRGPAGDKDNNEDWELV